MIAATHTALAAQSVGLGSTFMNGYIESEVKKVIGVADQESIAIAVLLPIGHPQEVPSNPGRFPSSVRVFHDTLP